MNSYDVASPIMNMYDVASQIKLRYVKAIQLFLSDLAEGPPLGPAVIQKYLQLDHTKRIPRLSSISPCNASS